MRQSQGVVATNGFKEKPLPNPSSEELETPVFNALWECIETWDVNVPEYYEGYSGANGSHVKLILDALLAAGINLSKDESPNVVSDLMGGCLSQALVDAIVHKAASVSTPLVNIVIRQVDLRTLPHLIVDHGDVVHILVAELRRKEHELECINQRLKGETL